MAQRTRKGKKIGDARGRTRRIRPCDGGDVQCHFVPGVATPSVFDPQLPRSRGIPQSEHTLATRSVPPRDQPRLTTPFVIERERNKRRIRLRSVTDSAIFFDSWRATLNCQSRVIEIVKIGNSATVNDSRDDRVVGDSITIYGSSAKVNNYITLEVSEDRQTVGNF